ncbi:hypothetical protein BFINE_06370 [Bacteroides finegoldii DSM 17565]|nr:hypothetical protein BFINE_06370 [Bacteroides finegoldii DSM 17565]
MSENTGTASFIENGKNGYKVPAGDPVALAEAIEKMVLYKEKLPILGRLPEKYMMRILQWIFLKRILKC